MQLITKFFDKISGILAIASVLLAPVVTWAALNVITRPAMVTVAMELPQRKGVVTLWDAVDNEVGLGGSPDWYRDYEAESKNYDSFEDVYVNTESWTPEDHVCMAKNIYFESRNESVKGQIAVALVTMTRVQDPRWPNTVCGVVYQNKQFSWYSDGLSDRPVNIKAYERIALIASAMLAPGARFEDFTHGSTHYHANYVSPYWTPYMVKRTSIDTHIFYFDPGTLRASL